METALENLSKEDLLKVISSRDHALSERDEKIDYLEAQLAMYKRMQFGQKRERFESDPNQTMLPFEAPCAEVEQQEQEIKEKIEYLRKRPNHKGRAKLPAHLPVEKLRSTQKASCLKWCVSAKKSPKSWSVNRQSSISNVISVINMRPKINLAYPWQNFLSG